MSPCCGSAEGLRILLLTHALNSLVQRLFVELRAAGHELSVELLSLTQALPWGHFSLPKARARQRQV